MVMTMESADPKFAQMTAQGLGMSPGELTVQGGTRQFVLHMRMPATDVKGPSTIGKSVPWYGAGVRRD
jgi:hypothetical protein